MDENENEELVFDEDTEKGWREYFDFFKKDVWPVFESYGFTFGEAFIVWTLNRVRNNVENLREETE